MHVKKYTTYAIYYAAGKLFKRAQSQYSTFQWYLAQLWLPQNLILCKLFRVLYKLIKKNDKQMSS
jgi:hypothetical protein